MRPLRHRERGQSGPYEAVELEFLVSFQRRERLSLWSHRFTREHGSRERGGRGPRGGCCPHRMGGGGRRHTDLAVRGAPSHASASAPSDGNMDSVLSSTLLSVTCCGHRGFQYFVKLIFNGFLMLLPEKFLEVGRLGEGFCTWEVFFFF